MGPTDHEKDTARLVLSGLPPITQRFRRQKGTWTQHLSASLGVSTRERSRFMEAVASNQPPGDKKDTRGRIQLFPAEEACSKEVRLERAGGVLGS